MQVQFNPDQVERRLFAATPVAVLEHRGDPARLGDSIERFIAWRRQTGLHPGRSATYNILHADPDAVAPAEYRIDLCAARDGPIAPNDAGVTEGLIAAGPCAVLRVVGSDAALGPGLRFLVTQWLAVSGAQRDGRPPFLHRLLLPGYAPGHGPITEIFLPLRA